MLQVSISEGEGARDHVASSAPLPLGSGELGDVPVPHVPSLTRAQGFSQRCLILPQKSDFCGLLS